MLSPDANLGPQVPIFGIHGPIGFVYTLVISLQDIAYLFMLNFMDTSTCVSVFVLTCIHAHNGS